MENPASTLQEPLKFFQWIFFGTNFQSFRSEFFSRFKVYNSVEYIEGEDEISYCMDVENNGIVIYDARHTKSFRTELSQRFNQELKRSQELIDTAVAEIIYNGISPATYIHLHMGSVKELQPGAVSINYPFVNVVLRELTKYLEKKQSSYFGKQEIAFEKNISEDLQIIEVEPKEQMIFEIINFLRGTYLSEIEWEKLKEYIISFIQKYEIPPITYQILISSKRLPMMKYVFYILYYKLGDRNLDKFSEFYLRVFENENPLEDDIKSISKKMATKPKLPEDFPQIK